VGFHGPVSAHAHRWAWIVLLTSLASLVLVANTGASGRPKTGNTGAAAPEEGQSRQYQGPQRWQYHGIEPRFGRTLAWQDSSNGSAAELNIPITSDLISPNSTSHSPIASADNENLLFSRPGSRIADRNGASIGTQIGSGTDREGRDARLMLEIGAALGLVYLAFLAVWFWTTRIRMHPPTSART
jgi:hypothetical protein